MSQAGITERSQLTFSFLASHVYDEKTAMPEIGGKRPQVNNPAAVTLQAKFKLGMTLHQQGKLADAERIYSDVLQQQPNHFNALRLLGVLAVQTRRPARGVALIRTAIELNANDAIGHSNLAYALLDLKLPEEALLSCDTAIALKPDFAMAHNNRGKALLGLKRPEDALVSFKKALELKRDDPGIWNNLSVALNVLCRWKEAEDAARKAVAIKPDFTNGWANLGCALIQLDRWDEAVVACKIAVNLKPDDVCAWNPLGYALGALGRWNEAAEACRMAVVLRPDDSEAWQNLSRCLFAQNRSVEAMEAVRRANALLPNPIGTNEILTGNLLKLREAVNRLVTEAITQGSPFVLKVEHFRALHRLAMRDLLPNPGEYRKRIVQVGNSPRVTPNWAHVPSLMDKLCHYVILNWTLRDPTHLGAFLLWRLNWIHPFDDGNGRVARAICCAVLCIQTASSLANMKSLDEAILANYLAYTTALRRAHDTYSHTRDIEQATRHVEQWLEPLVNAYLTDRSTSI